MIAFRFSTKAVRDPLVTLFVPGTLFAGAAVSLGDLSQLPIFPPALNRCPITARNAKNLSIVLPIYSDLRSIRIHAFPITGAFGRNGVRVPGGIIVEGTNFERSIRSELYLA